LRTCVEHEYVSHHDLIVLYDRGFATSYDLDVNHILLGIQLPELKVLLVVIQSTCGTAAAPAAWRQR
jgi:hypothetical protein